MTFDTVITSYVMFCFYRPRFTCYFSA